MTFEQLELIEPLQKALKEEQYTHPTPIQQQAIPHALDGRALRDLLPEFRPTPIRDALVRATAHLPATQGRTGGCCAMNRARNQSVSPST